MRTMKLRMILGASILVVVLALAPAALAGNASVQGYGGGGNQAAGLAGSGSDPGNSGASENSVGSLPFTGMDLSLLAGGGFLLLLAGVGMARLMAMRGDSPESS